MANNHETLTSLFSDIADAIREVKGETSDVQYKADDFPYYIAQIWSDSSKEKTPHSSLSHLFTDIADTIRGIKGDTTNNTYKADDFPALIRNYSLKMEKILNPSLSDISSSITVKALTYYDGYWYGVGNDSSGNMYKLYGSTVGNLNIVGLNKNFLASCIICDGTNVWVGLNSGSYDNAETLIQTVDVFRSTATGASYHKNYNRYYTDACIVNGYNVFSGGYIDTQGAIVDRIPVGSTSRAMLGYATYIPESFVSCCSFKGYFVGITSNGYKGVITNIETGAILHKKIDILNGAQKIRALGDYLCVVCVKEGGTYIYYSSNDPSDSTSFNNYTSLKITDEILTIVDMVYINGLYILLGYNSSGETKVYQSIDISQYGSYKCISALTNDGYIPRAMATDGTNICILADNGIKIRKAITKIS